MSCAEDGDPATTAYLAPASERGLEQEGHHSDHHAEGMAQPRRIRAQRSKAIAAGATDGDCVEAELDQSNVPAARYTQVVEEQATKTDQELGSRLQAGGASEGTRNGNFDSC